MNKVNPNTKKVYRDRFNPTQTNQDWTQVLFKEGVYLQGAELNEIQSIIIHRLGSVINRLIPDGALLAGGEMTEFVDERTGLSTVNLREAVVKYFSTLFRVPARDLILQGSEDGSYTIGVLLTRQYLTAVQNPILYQEEEVVQGFGTEGADREFWDAQWTFKIDGLILPGFTQPLEIQDLDTNPDKYFFPVYRLPTTNGGVINKYNYDFRNYLSTVINEINNSFIVSGLELINTGNAGKLTTTGGGDKFRYQDIDYLEFSLSEGLAYIQGKRVRIDSKQVFKIPRALEERYIDRDRIDLLEKDAFPSKVAFVCLGLTLDSTVPTLDSNVFTLDTYCDVYKQAVYFRLTLDSTIPTLDADTTIDTYYGAYRRPVYFITLDSTTPTLDSTTATLDVDGTVPIQAINFSFTLSPVDLVLNSVNQTLYPNASITITISVSAFELPADNNLAKVLLRDLFYDVLTLLPNESLPNVNYSARNQFNEDLILNVDFTENDVKEAILHNFLIVKVNLTEVDVLGRVVPAIKFYSRKFGELGRSYTLTFTTDNYENITSTLSSSNPPKDNFEGGLLRPIVPLNFRPVSQVGSVEIGYRVRKVLTRSTTSAIDDPGVDERITDIEGVVLVFDNHTNYRPGLDFNVTTDGRLSWDSALNAPTPGQEYIVIYSTTKTIKPGKAKHLVATETLIRDVSLKEQLVSPPRRNILSVIRVVSGNKLYRLGVDYYVNLDRTGIEFIEGRGPSDGSTFDIEFEYGLVYESGDYISIDKYDFNSRVLVKRAFNNFDPDLVKLDNFYTRSLDIRNGIELSDSRLYQLEQPVFVSYYYYLNREDLVYLDSDGNVRVLRGKSEYQNYIAPPVPYGVLPIASIQLPADSTAKDIIVRHFGNKSVSQTELFHLVTRVKEIESILLELVLRQKVIEEIPCSASLVDANSDNFTNLGNLDTQDDLIKDNTDSVLIPIASLSALELPSELTVHDKSPDLVVDLERSFIDSTSWSHVYTLPFSTYIAKSQLSITTSTVVQNITLPNNIASSTIGPSIDEWVDRVTDEQLIEQISTGWIHASKLSTRKAQLINLIRWYQGEDTDETYFPWVDRSLDFPHASSQDYVDYLGITKRETDNTRRSNYNLIDAISQDYSLMRPRRIEFELRGFLPNESIRVRFAGFDLPCFPLGLTQQGLSPDRGFHLDAILLSVKPQDNSFDYSALRKRVSRAYSNYEFNWQGVNENSCLLEHQKPNNKIITHYLKRTVQQVFGLPENNPLVREVIDGLLDNFDLIENTSGTVKADANGNAKGFFHVPLLLIPTGDKVVEFIGNQRSYARSKFLAFNHKNRVNNKYKAETKSSIYQEIVDRFSPVDTNSKYSPITWEYIDGRCKPVQSVLGRYATEEACILDNPPPPPFIPTRAYPINTADKYQLPILQKTPNSDEFVFINGYHEIYLNTGATDNRQYKVKSVLGSPELVSSLSKLQVKIIETSDLTDASSLKLILFGIIQTTFTNAGSFSTLKLQSTTEYDISVVLEDSFNSDEYIFNFVFVPGYALNVKPKEQQLATAKSVTFLPESLYEYYSNVSIPNPIGYTFALDKITPVRSVKLAITKVPTDKNKIIRVEIRNTLSGYPGDTILGSAELRAGDVECLEPLTGEAGQPEFTEFVFTKEPIYLNPFEVYCIVVVATDAGFEVAVADSNNTDIFTGSNNTLSSLAVLADKNEPDKFFVSNNGTVWSLFYNRRLCFELVGCSFYGLKVGTIERLSGDNCLNRDAVVSSSDPEGFEGCLVLRGRTNVYNSQVFVPARYNTFDKTSLTCQYTGSIPGCNSEWINIHYNRLNIIKKTYNTFAIRHLFYGRDGVAPVLAKDSPIVVTGRYNYPANYITKEVVLSEDTPFNNVRILVDEYLPPQCNVVYSLSVDGGVTWIVANNELGPNGEITTTRIDENVKSISSSLKYEFNQRVCTWELASDFIYDSTLKRRVGGVFTQLSGYARRYKIRISATTTDNTVSPTLRNLRIVAYDDVASNRMLAQNEGRVKIDAKDISSGFLKDKLVAGRGIDIVPVQSQLDNSPSYIEIKLTDLGLLDDTLFTGNVTIGTDEVRPYLKIQGNYANIIQDDGIGSVDSWVIDLSKSSIHKRIVTQSGQLRLPINPLGSGQQMVLIIIQSSPNGGVNIAWPADFKWAGGVVPHLSQQPGAVDILEGIYDASPSEFNPNGVWYVRLIKNFFS